MKLKRRASERGHAHIELNIHVALMMIGAALAGPGIVKWFRHEPLTTGGGILVGLGSLVFLAAAGMLARFFIVAWLESRR
jgi:hypothetical protein